MKKYTAYDSYNGWEFFDTLKEAREYFQEIIDDGCWDNMAVHEIYELREEVKFIETDRKENYDYLEEEDVPEGEDGDVWPYANDVDHVGYLKFIEVKSEGG